MGEPTAPVLDPARRAVARFVIKPIQACWAKRRRHLPAVFLVGIRGAGDYPVLDRHSRKAKWRGQDSPPGINLAKCDNAAFDN